MYCKWDDLSQGVYHINEVHKYDGGYTPKIGNAIKVGISACLALSQLRIADVPTALRQTHVNYTKQDILSQTAM